MALGCLIAMAAAGGGVAEAAGPGPAIEWTVPARLGADRNGDGLVDYAGSAAEFEREEGGFPVDLRLRAGLCRDDATYAWRFGEEETVLAGRRGCAVRHTYGDEGRRRVSVEIRRADGGRELHSRAVVVQDWLVVSIGDSVGSGEGDPEVGGNFRPARWQSARCHRSSLASPAQAALALEDESPRTSTTFVHLACSGAKLTAGLLAPYDGVDAPTGASALPPQVEELERIARRRPIDAVIVNIGANDAYFGPLVTFCLIHTDCATKRFDPGDPEHPVAGEAEPLPRVIAAALARLPVRYAKLARRLARIIEPRRTLIVDYFDPTHDENGEFCKRIGFPDPIFGVGQIDRGEAEWASQRLLTPLNGEIEATARKAGWTEVTGVAEAFRTHGYCASDSWIRHFAKSWFSQKGNHVFSRVAGLLHPNETGHAATARLIGAALRRVLGSGAPPAGGASAAAGAVNVAELTISGDEDRPESGSEAGAEHAALVALIVLLLAAGPLLVFGLVHLFGNRFALPVGEAVEAEIVDPSEPDEWPDLASTEAFGAMVEASPDISPHWVHRRVESIDIVDKDMIRRRVSVDFTPIAERGAATHAPIALLGKGGPLASFDLRDEGGASVPLLTRQENAAFSAAHLLAIATEVAAERGHEGELPDRLRALCWKIAQGEPWEAEDAIVEIADALEPKSLRNALRDSDRFRSAAYTFAESFPVIVAIDDPGQRRVMKLSYSEIAGDGPRGWERVGLDPVLVWVELPELGDAASRHLEFSRVEGLEMFNSQLVGEAPDGSRIAGEGGAGAAYHHLVVANAPRGSRGIAGVWLRTSRAGILVGGPLLAALSAAALTGAWFALPQLVGENAGGAASILLAVPAAFAAYLGARKPHPLEAEMLTGARVLVFVAGILAFLGAGALALDASVETLRILLGTVAALSWLPVGGLFLTLFLPRGPPRGNGGGVV